MRRIFEADFWSLAMSARGSKNRYTHLSLSLYRNTKRYRRSVGNGDRLPGSSIVYSSTMSLEVTTDCSKHDTANVLTYATEAQLRYCNTCSALLLTTFVFARGLP